MPALQNTPLFAKLTSRHIPILVLLFGYLFLHLALLPTDASVSGGFSHDSAYIGIVAGQVNAGNGFVNPAHWLLFLDPPSLPMPFHNANPLYPTAVAACTYFTGLDAARSGFVVSALASSLLMLVVYLLCRHYDQPVWFALLAAAAAGVFPSNLRDSWSVLPDGLATALLAGMVLLVVRARRPVNWVWAGGAFGLAWLTRSTSTLVIPGLLWWMWRTMPLRDMVVRLTVFGMAATLCVSPWLLHNYQVWGSPLRSDSYFYWIQSYAAARNMSNVDQYWRSLTPPPPAAEVFGEELPQFLSYSARGAQPFISLFLALISERSRVAKTLLLLIFALATWLNRHRLRSAEPQAGALVFILSVISLLPRAEGLEIRYLSFSICTMLLWVLLPFTRVVQSQLERALTALCLLYVTMVMFPQDWRIWESATQPAPEAVAFRTAVREVNQRFPGARMISHRPYFFTYYTGVSALSPPASSKADLLEFMKKYDVRHVLLPTSGLDYYYPGGVFALQPEIQRKAEANGYTLFETERVP